MIEAIETCSSYLLQVVAGQYNTETHTLDLTLYALQGAFLKPNHPSEWNKYRRHYQNIQSVMAHFYGTKPPGKQVIVLNKLVFAENS